MNSFGAELSLPRFFCIVAWFVEEKILLMKHINMPVDESSFKSNNCENLKKNKL